jgi:energy-coupling factor transport system ATP-binding protein
VQALRGVTLTLPPGVAVAIVGENGAGKTTLVKHFNGLLRPTSGSVVVGEWDTRRYTVAKLASRVGYVFQNPDDQLFARTVIKEVSFGPKNLGRSEADAEAAARAALEAVGLADQADTHPYDLHLSQRKLLALAAVLAMHTPVIVPAWRVSRPWSSGSRPSGARWSRSRTTSTSPPSTSTRSW